MNIHKNARLTFIRRAEMIQDVLKARLPACHVAQLYGVSAPTVSEHMRVLTSAKLVRAKRIKQWTMYKRNETAIAAIKRSIQDGL